MQFEQFTIDRIEDAAKIFDNATNTQTSLVQLSAGGLGYHSDSVGFDDLRIEWNGLDASVRSRDHQLDWGLLLIVNLPGCTPMNFRGLRCDETIGCIYRPGSTLDYVAHPGTRTLVVCIPQRTLDARNWRVAEGAFRRIDGEARDVLLASCSQARDLARNRPTSRAEAKARDDVLDALEALLSPWLQGKAAVLPRRSGAHYFELVDDTERLWRSEGRLTPPSTAALAERLGVAQRTLFHSFQRALGVSPRRYLELLRLHELRVALCHAHPKSATVAQLAGARGYEQPGRLSLYYRRHFGETPVETLRRQVPLSGPDR